jgi:pilus assembly protein Flp/PilA
LRCTQKSYNQKQEDVMQAIGSSLKKFLASEDGPTTVEYAVMLALVIVLCLTALQAISTNARTTLASLRARFGGL